MSASSFADHGQFSSLRAWDILENLAPPPFAACARLAAHLAQAGAAVITAPTEEGWRTVAVHGLAAEQAEAFSPLRDPEMMAAEIVVEDMAVDVRFSRDPLVCGAQPIRFLFGLPLAAAGESLGMLWLLDGRPRDLDPSDLGRLREFATLLSGLMRMRRDVEALGRQALHDSVTGLGNRPAFECHLDLALKRTARRHGLSVIVLRTDRLQSINGMFGFAGGNQMLRELGRRLREGLGETAFGARLGGGEYAVLLPETEGRDEVEAMTRRLVDALHRPMVIGGQAFELEIVAGLARYPHDGETAAALLESAQANPWVDRVGQGAAQATRDELAELLTHPLAEDLQAALTENQFYLYWQPVADAASRQPIGYEALLRWDRPGYGPVPPGEFIGAAEQVGLGGALDEWVLHAVCQEALKWEDRVLRAAVNVSSRADNLALLPQRIAAALQASGLAPSRLEIEIPARALLEDEVTVRAILPILRDLGVRIAFDNFPADPALLNSLRDLPVDKLKLDRAITREIGADFSMRDWVRGLVKLSDVIGFIMLAQGVESEEQLTALKALGCDQMQGYLLGWPRPIVEGRREHAAASLLRVS